MTPRPPRPRRVIASSLVLLGVLALTAVVARPAYAADQDCGGNDYVDVVEVQDYTGGQFEIKVVPTSNSRYAELGNHAEEATISIWQAVRSCVPTLTGSVADGIYQQIRCHIYGGVSGPFHAGGPTYDLESWREPVGWPTALRSRCNWGGWPYEAVGEPYRPDQLAPTT